MIVRIMAGVVESRYEESTYCGFGVFVIVRMMAEVVGIRYVRIRSFIIHKFSRHFNEKYPATTRNGKLET